MKKEQILLSGMSYDVQNVRSTDSLLKFELCDVDKMVLESILKNKENVNIIKYIQKDMNTQDETLLKAYAGYVNLSQMDTKYGVVTKVDYETRDETTQSGFAEEKHDITTVSMMKVSKVESDIEKLRETQELQDGAIEDIAGAISDIADGQALQDGAIEDVAEAVSNISGEQEE